MEYNCVLKTILDRVSIRKFKYEPIPLDIVQRIIEAGIRAPTAGGGEEWFFIIVLSEAKRRRIHELLKKAHILYAEKLLRRPLSRSRLEKWIKLMEEGQYLAPVYIAGYIDLRNPLYSNEYRELEELWAHQSIAAAFENMILAAWSMGLGSVWLGVPLLLEEEFNKVLEPPKGLKLAGIIALGYPDERPRPRKRKSLEEVSKII